MMSGNNSSVSWSSERFPKQGRPLTKRTAAQPYSYRHQENLANTSRLQKERPIGQYSSSHLTPEEEWNSLEREIFRMCLQPSENIANSTSIISSDLEPRVLKPVDIGIQDQQLRKFCQFCAKNGEVRNVVESHNLRHPVTRVILCPILRRYTCELCGATGDDAHTKFYCPRNPNRLSAPTAVLLKSTRNNASGRRS